MAFDLRELEARDERERDSGALVGRVQFGDAAGLVEPRCMDGQNDVLFERCGGAEGDAGVVGDWEVLGVREGRIGTQFERDGVRWTCDFRDCGRRLDAGGELERGLGRRRDVRSAKERLLAVPLADDGGDVEADGVARVTLGQLGHVGELDLDGLLWEDVADGADERCGDSERLVIWRSLKASGSARTVGRRLLCQTCQLALLDGVIVRDSRLLLLLHNANNPRPVLLDHREPVHSRASGYREHVRA